MRYTVGQFVVDASHRAILGEEQTIALPPKEFDLLFLLIKRHGHVVSKAEIFEELWPDVVVTEGNLTQYIYRLRSVLGNDAIRTIPKRGYELVAPVRQELETEVRSEDSRGDAAADLVPRAIPKRKWTWAALALAALLVAVGIWRSPRFQPDGAAYDLVLRGEARMAAALLAKANVRPAEEQRAAIALFRRAVEIDPKYADAYGALAQALCASNRAMGPDVLVQQAEEYAGIALQTDPNNVAARTALICAAHVRGNQAAALRLGVELSGLPGQSAASSFAAGDAFLRAGLIDRAIPLLRQAIRLEPGAVEYRQQLAQALMLSRQFAECLDVLSPLLKTERGGYWHAMNCLTRAGRRQEAILYGERLVKLEPDSPPAYRALALTYRATGREAEATALFTRAVQQFEGQFELGPNARNATFLALLNAHLHNRAQTERWLRRAASLDADNSWILFHSGVAYAILGDDFNAMELLERAVERGFLLQSYFDWQIQPEMGVPTLNGSTRFRSLYDRVRTTLTKLDASLGPR